MALEARGLVQVVKARPYLVTAVMLGTASQTAGHDLHIQGMRRIGTVHTIIAFGFNTAILATMINLAFNYF